MGMDRVYQTAKAGQERIVIGAKPLPSMPSGKAHRTGLGNDQSRSSLGPFAIIGDGPIAHRPIGMGKIVSHGGHEDPVFQPKAVQGKGGEEGVKAGHGLPHSLISNLNLSLNLNQRFLSFSFGHLLEIGKYYRVIFFFPAPAGQGISE